MTECLTRVLHRLRARSVDSDLTDDVEDQVLGLDPFLESVVIDELERLGDAEPELAQREDASEVGRADAGREVVESSIGARVRVGADDELARQDEAVFRQHGVADAALSHLEVPLDSHLVGELAREATKGGARCVFRGLEVVLRHRHTFRVPDPFGAHLLAHDLSGRRDGEVVPHRKVDLGENQVSGTDTVAPGSTSQDLLGHRHAHRALALPNPSAFSPPHRRLLWSTGRRRDRACTRPRGWPIRPHPRSR